MSGVAAFRDRFLRQGSWSTENDGNPYQMVFVVRNKLDDGMMPSEDDAMSACVSTMLSLLDGYGTDPDLTNRVDEWIKSRIRKIVKRAHGSKWRKLESAVESGDVAIQNSVMSNAHGEGVVYAFAPMRASEMPKVLRNLQVSGLDLERSQCDNLNQQESGSERTLLVTLNDDVEMTSGKAIAQACHVAQVALKALDDDDFSEWCDSGLQCQFAWKRLCDDASNHDVVIHDAGFTEVPSNSLTAVGDIV